MKALKIIMFLLSFFVSLPIWYVLLHAILVAINADRLLWFLYWVYLPVGLLSAAIGAVLKHMED